MKFYKIIAATLLLSVGYAEESKSEAKVKSPKVEKKLVAASITADDFVWIPTGDFKMGATDTDNARKDELPIHLVQVTGFYMKKTLVTNSQFKAFIDATKYVTTAEKKPKLEDVIKQLPEGTQPPPEEALVAGAIVFFATAEGTKDYWWQFIPGAYWRYPRGIDYPSNVHTKSDHPVVEMSWYDANAFSKWIGGTIPTEAQWEYAARGGVGGKTYVWGDSFPTAKNCNIWGGKFPHLNDYKDGFIRTAPVSKFPANGFGLYDMCGNAIEWCQDIFNENYYKECKDKKIVTDPQGAETPLDSNGNVPPTVEQRVQRGGSFLSSKVYDKGYRVAIRMSSTPDTGAENTSFRVVLTPAQFEKKFGKDAANRIKQEQKK